MIRDTAYCKAVSHCKEGDLKKGLLIVKEYHTPTGRQGDTYVHIFTLRKEGLYINIETGCIQNGWPIHGSYFGEVSHDKKRIRVEVFNALIRITFEETFGGKLNISDENLLESLSMICTKNLFVCLTKMALRIGMQACWLWKWKPCRDL